MSSLSLNLYISLLEPYIKAKEHLGQNKTFHVVVSHLQS